MAGGQESSQGDRETRAVEVRQDHLVLCPQSRRPLDTLAGARGEESVAGPHWLAWTGAHFSL